MPNPSMSAAIVGAAESNKIGYIEEGTTATLLHLEAIANVCEQIGIKPSEIDGTPPFRWWSASRAPALSKRLQLIRCREIVSPQESTGSAAQPQIARGKGIRVTVDTRRE